MTLDISVDNAIGYKNFIPNSLKNFNAKYSLQNQIQSKTDKSIYRKGGIVQVNDHIIRQEKLKENILKLTNGQKNAYDKAIKHLSGEDKEQLLMFVSGEGGTGKSTLIELIMEYTRLKHGKQKGFYGAAVAMAPTGTAAYNINGFTWQSVSKVTT